MMLDRLKTMLDERPFVPFEIHTSDGDVIPVKSADFAWIHPGKRTMFVATDPRYDTEYGINLRQITKLALTRGANGGRRRGGGSKRS
jgi:hypothetical protein